MVSVSQSMHNLHQNRHFGHHVLVEGTDEARAFTLSDIEFLTIGRKKLTLAEALRCPMMVARARIRWRYQKNGDNGDTREYSRNSDIDCIEALLNIVRNFVNIMGTDCNTPVGLYRNDDGSVEYIHEALITRVFKAAAIAVYDFDPVQDKTELSKFTSHSLRVGACCMLYSSGVSETKLKYLLRWRSDSFLAYLRNLASVTDDQNRAVSAACANPMFY